MADPNPTDYRNDAGTGTVRSDGFIGPTSGGSGSFTTITATGVVDVANGTAAAPEITFTSDTDTGFYRSAANTLGIATGGAQALLIGASGIISFNVGAVGTPSLTFTGDLDTGIYWIGANSFGLAANGVVQVTITTAGANGIIGGTTPAAGTFTTLIGTTIDGIVGSVTPAAANFTFVRGSVSNTLTAVGTNRATALALTASINNVTTAGSGTGVILPASASVGIGGTVIVYSNGANAIQVYAAGSDTIDTVAGSTGVVLTNTKRCAYRLIAAATFVSDQLGVVSA